MKFLDVLRQMGINIDTCKCVKEGKQDINFKEIVSAGIEDILENNSHFYAHIKKIGITLDFSSITINFPNEIQDTFANLIEAYKKDMEETL